MAPPKRKTGGRVTPKANPRVTPGGGRADQRKDAAPGSTSATVESVPARTGSTRVAASSRYTPKVDRHQLESPSWVPALMLAFFVLGGLAIMSRYLIWDSTNVPMIVGLLFLLAGLYTATKWR